MNGRFQQRLEKLEGAAKGVCVSCLWNDLLCDHPHWEGSRRCGRDRQDLPHVLFANEEDAAYQSWVRDLTDEELEAELKSLRGEEDGTPENGG